MDASKYNYMCLTLVYSRNLIIFETSNNFESNKRFNYFSSWVWAEAGAQSSLEESLEMGGFGYPAMAVVNAKKLKFSTLRGSYSETGINEFLRYKLFKRF